MIRQVQATSGPRYGMSSAQLAEFARFYQSLQRLGGTDHQTRLIGLVPCHAATNVEQVRVALEQVAEAALAAGDELPPDFQFLAMTARGQLLAEDEALTDLMGVLLVVEPNSTSAEHLRHRVQALRSAGSKVLGILMLETEVSLATKRRSLLGFRKSKAIAPTSRRILRRGELASNLQDLMNGAAVADERFVAISIDRVDSTKPVSSRTLKQLLTARPDLQGRLGRLAMGGLGVLVPQASASQGHVVAADLHAQLEALHEKAKWSVRVTAYPPHAETAPKLEAPTPHGVILNNSLDAFFARPTPRWKRTMDVVLAAGGLIALMPLLLVAGLLVKLTSKGPVFFHQWRTGHGGRPFRMIKFRTMVEGAERMQQDLAAMNEQDGPAFKIRSDPRVTLLGKVLRRTCIDELPQLWNVLRGEMSLVGPRPLPLAEQAAASVEAHERLRVAPGLTCYWQARGRELTSFEEWMRLDVQYMREQSLLVDLGILLATVPVIVPHPWKKKGSQAPPAASGPAEPATKGKAYVQS